MGQHTFIYRRSLFFLLILCLAAFWFLPANADGGRKKVAVVLSGGGAKGSAHIGVLQAIEEAGIPIDYVVGTSMGAVVGGLYAAGYTPMQLDTLIKNQDWEVLLSDNTVRKVQTLNERENSETYLISVPFSELKNPNVGGLVQGQNLANLLSRLTIGYHDSIDFRTLPTPFACVATNLVDGAEVVLTCGILATSIRASMAIPGMFTPVNKDSMVLIDGGMVNNYPVDVAKALGADIVIGSTVQNELPDASSLTNLPDIIAQIITIACRQKYEANIDAADLNLNIDTKEYTMLDFKAAVIDSLIQRGKRTAYMQWDDLMDIRRLVFADTLYTAPASRDTMTSSSPYVTVNVRNITYINTSSREIKTIERKCRLAENSEIDISQIEAAVTLLRKEYNYSDAYYTLTPVEEGYDLTFHTTQKSQSNVKFGVRFDSKEMIAAIARGDIFFNTDIPTSLSLMGKIGKQCMAGITYTFEPRLSRSLNIGYTFYYNDIDIYYHGDRLYNLILRKHQVVAQMVNLALRNFRFQAGLSMEYFDYSLLHSSTDAVTPTLKSDTYLSYFVKLKYDTQDNSSYPSRGVACTAAYTLLTDNFAGMDGNAPVSIASASLTAALPLNNRFTFLPKVHCRFLFGSGVPHIYYNSIGGNFDCKYLPQQIAFVGLNNTEYLSNSMLAGSLNLRFRIGASHYITATADLAVSSDQIADLMHEHFTYAIGAKYGFSSKFGPMEMSLGYCGDDDNPSMLVNLGYYF